VRGCHARFDTVGLAFEGYGPIGEARSKDLGGRPVDTAATFPGGFDGKGFAGVQAFIKRTSPERFCRRPRAQAGSVRVEPVAPTFR